MPGSGSGNGPENVYLRSRVRQRQIAVIDAIIAIYSGAVMVEVCAELQGSGTYLAGEWVICSISFTNHSPSEETVAWAGAQLHCQHYCRESVVKVDTALLSLPSPVTNTAFVPNRGERGHTLLSTPTSVLFCNLTLQPGDSKTVIYSEQIPCGGPPSFSGRLVKYSYKLAVGAQKPNHPAQIVRIPFRLMTIPESLLGSSVAPSPKDPNPFLAAEEREDPSLDLALQALATETSRKTSMNYTLKNAHGIVGRVSLFKPSYKLGEDVTGTFDLSSATVACLQFSVALQCVEEVHQESLQREATVQAVCSTHSRHSESCPNTLLTHFALPIPLTVTQSFQNTTVVVRWQLHFEFLVSRGAPSSLVLPSSTPCLSGSRAELSRGLQPHPLDPLTWDLPLPILPSLPTHTEHRTTTHSVSL